MGDPHVFRFAGSFEIPLTPAEAWAQLRRTEHYESWWPWMRRLEVGGEPLEPGTTFAFLVVAPIPFTMRLRARITGASAPDRIEAAVSGDLAGTAAMAFQPSDGGTRADIEWEVEVVRARLRPVARVTRPVLLWGQRWAVDIAIREFRRHLRAA